MSFPVSASQKVLALLLAVETLAAWLFRPYGCGITAKIPSQSSGETMQNKLIQAEDQLMLMPIVAHLAVASIELDVPSAHDSYRWPGKRGSCNPYCCEGSSIVHLNFEGQKSCQIALVSQTLCFGIMEGRIFESGWSWGLGFGFP